MLVATKQIAVVVGYLIVFTLTVGACVWAYVLYGDLSSTSGWVIHSSDVNEAITRSESAVQMAQVQGSFKMANIPNSRSLEDYRADAFQSIDNIAKLVVDNPDQYENAQELHNAVQQRFEIQDRSISLYLAKQSAPDSQVTASAQAMQRVTIVLKRLNDQENQLMRQRFQGFLGHLYKTVTLAIIGISLLFISLTLSAIWTFRALGKQVSLAQRVSDNVKGTPLENDPTIAEIKKVLTNT